MCPSQNLKSNILQHRDDFPSLAGKTLHLKSFVICRNTATKKKRKFKRKKKRARLEEFVCIYGSNAGLFTLSSHISSKSSSSNVLKADVVVYQ